MKSDAVWVGLVAVACWASLAGGDITVTYEPTTIAPGAETVVAVMVSSDEPIGLGAALFAFSAVEGLEVVAFEWAGGLGGDAYFFETELPEPQSVLFVGSGVMVGGEPVTIALVTVFAGASRAGEVLELSALPADGPSFTDAEFVELAVASGGSVGLSVASDGGDPGDGGTGGGAGGGPVGGGTGGNGGTGGDGGTGDAPDMMDDGGDMDDAGGEDADADDPGADDTDDGMDEGADETGDDELPDDGTGDDGEGMDVDPDAGGEGDASGDDGDSPGGGSLDGGDADGAGDGDAEGDPSPTGPAPCGIGLAGPLLFSLSSLSVITTTRRCRRFGRSARR